VDGHELAELKPRVQACFEAGALATGCRVETKWGETDFLDLKTSWPMAEAYERNAKTLGLEFFPLKDLPPGYAGSTDMGNVSHRVPSIHPCLSVAPLNVIIHNAEFARHAISDKGDQAVIDGAKSMAMTALDLLGDGDMLARTKSDFEATAELSKIAIGTLTSHHGHAHGGCGCA
jgi:metal-dependent amidase/aminoacylase/carboxypeptidase family protein